MSESMKSLTKGKWYELHDQLFRHHGTLRERFAAVPLGIAGAVDFYDEETKADWLFLMDKKKKERNYGSDGFPNWKLTVHNDTLTEMAAAFLRIYHKMCEEDRHA